MDNIHHTFEINCDLNTDFRQYICIYIYTCFIYMLNIDFQNGVTGFDFNVYNATSCPRNKSDIIERSIAMNCTEKNPYICLPNKELTVLLEMCHHEPLKGVSPGKKKRTKNAIQVDPVQIIIFAIKRFKCLPCFDKQNSFNMFTFRMTCRFMFTFGYI